MNGSVEDLIGLNLRVKDQNNTALSQGEAAVEVTQAQTAATEDLAEARLKAAKTNNSVIAGFSEGGFKGGMTAMQRSLAGQRAAFNTEGLSKEKRAELAKKAGYTISDDGQSYTGNKRTRAKQWLANFGGEDTEGKAGGLLVLSEYGKYP